MVSRKRNQGKARKAAKARDSEQAEEMNNQTTNGQQQQSSGAQMQQLQIGNSSLPLILQNGVAKCRHGFELMVMDIVCTKFVIAFREAYNDAAGTIFDFLRNAENATAVEYSEVWNDSAKMETILSFLLCNGTQHLLDRNNGYYRDYAIFARYFEQYIAVELRKTQALINWLKIEELTIRGDEHTLVKFFRRRIPCSCLDEKYQEVKLITKMGLCYNPQCSHPDWEVERSKTMYCSRCRCVTYCSRQCQKADWLSHKSICDKDVAIKAEFDAKHEKT
jgi:hypothetical protein